MGDKARENNKCLHLIQRTRLFLDDLIVMEVLGAAREAGSRKVPIKNPNPKGKQILKETTATTTFGGAKMPIPDSAAAKAVADSVAAQVVAEAPVGAGKLLIIGLRSVYNFFTIAQLSLENCLTK